MGGSGTMERRSCRLSDMPCNKGRENTMDKFKAYVISRSEARVVSAAFTTMDVTALDPGEVLVRVAYASINFI